jgi:hypothetical protein
VLGQSNQQGGDSSLGNVLIPVERSRGRFGRLKNWAGRSPGRGGFLGYRKADFWFPPPPPGTPKKPEIHFSTPKAGLSGQKPIMAGLAMFTHKSARALALAQRGFLLFTSFFRGVGPPPSTRPVSQSP